MPVLAALEPEDARLWRMCMARQEAIRVKPDAYTREEIEQTFYSEYRMAGEFIDKYGVDPALQMSIPVWTASIEVKV